MTQRTITSSKEVKSQREALKKEIKKAIENKNVKLKFPLEEKTK